MAMEDHSVSCKTLEGETIQVPFQVLRQSQTFYVMERDLGLAGDASFTFPVAIKTEIFKKLVDWCKNHIDSTDPIVKEDPVTKERIWFNLTDYEKRFFEVSVDELVELIAAANYMDVKSLYLLGCQSLASLIRGKTPEEVRKIMDIENDLTEEEVQEIKKQNPWCNY